MYPTVGVTRDKESLLLVLPCWCYKRLVQQILRGETTLRLEKQVKVDRLEEKNRAAGGPFGELSWCRVRGGFYIIEAAFTCSC